MGRPQSSKRNYIHVTAETGLWRPIFLKSEPQLGQRCLSESEPRMKYTPSLQWQVGASIFLNHHSLNSSLISSRMCLKAWVTLYQNVLWDHVTNNSLYVSAHTKWFKWFLKVKSCWWLKRHVLNFCILPNYHISQLCLLLYKQGIYVSIWRFLAANTLSNNNNHTYTQSIKVTVQHRG